MDNEKKIDKIVDKILSNSELEHLSYDDLLNVSNRLLERILNVTYPFKSEYDTWGKVL